MLNAIGIADDPGPAPLPPTPSVAEHAMLCVPFVSTNDPLLAATFKTVVAPSVQVTPVIPAALSASTCTSTPSVPLVAAVYQPLSATVSPEAVVIVISGGATAMNVAKI